MGNLEKQYEKDLGYYKTRYHIVFPKELSDGANNAVANMDRLDLGDGYFVNPHHQVKEEGKARIIEKQFESLDNAVIN